MATLEKLKENETINEVSQSQNLNNNSKLNNNNNNNNDIGMYTLHSLSEEFNCLTKKVQTKEEYGTKNDIKHINIRDINNNLTVDNNYINELKEYYERHINESFKNFRTCLNKLEEIARQNNNYKITASLLKEIIDDNIFYEREKQIMNFIKEIKETQAQKEKIKNELKQNEINNMNKRLEIELNKKKNYKKISRELTVTVEKKNAEISELQKNISIMEQEKKENAKSMQKKREEYEKLKKDYSTLETQKIEIEIKYKNLLDENKSLEKINKNYEKDKQILYQDLEEEKKKLKENLVRECGAEWSRKLKIKIRDIQNIKQSIISIKNEYKNKYAEFLSQYKNSLLLINEKITEFDNQNRENIKKIEKKYEKHLNEQLLINNKLKRQNEELINKKNEENIDSQRRSFKITELENELNNHKAMVEKLKMDLDKKKAIIEAILYSAGRLVEARELMYAIEVNYDELNEIIANMKEDMLNNSRGLEIIRAEDSYQLCTKKEYYEYIYPVFDKRSKPNLSNAAIETLSIIAYNPKITRAQIEAIRGVSSDGTVYKLLEYNLIEEAGKLDAPGRPTMYKTTNNFLKMFGMTNLDELPELPRYKIDENEQIVIDDITQDIIIEKNNNEDDNN